MFFIYFGGLALNDKTKFKPEKGRERVGKTCIEPDLQLLQDSSLCTQPGELLNAPI